MISKNYCTWKARMLDVSTCIICRSLHGKVYEIGKKYDPKPPIHPYCRCKIGDMPAVCAGEATSRGKDGSDWWLKLFGELPDYYITENEAIKRGWERKKGNLQEVLPGMMIGGSIYYNKDGHLPDAKGRIWNEADLEYTGKYRGTMRIVYSNDGLIFITFDHYATFIEVV